jgi:putative DNA methylase
VLFASLVDDPDSDPGYRLPNGRVDEERAGGKRAQLFDLIEELVQWENSNNPRVIEKARAEIARCIASRKIELGELKKEVIVHGPGKGEQHPRGPVSGQGVTAWEVVMMTARAEVVNTFLAEYAPPVLDPFCGGGSVPLEAQRLGLRAVASDLNPVAVLITKALIEIPPKFAGRSPVRPEMPDKRKKGLTDWSGARGLAEDVRYYGEWMLQEAKRRIGHLYPTVKATAEMAEGRPDLREYVGTELTVIAWLWARTVASPNPAARGVHVPLVRSFWLSTKKGAKAWIKPVVSAGATSYEFTVEIGAGEAPPGTVGRPGGTCILTHTPIPLAYIRAEGKAGRIGNRLMAIVAEGARGRVYLPPDDTQQLAAQVTCPPGAVPDTDLPDEALGFRVQNYGMSKHAHLFTARQIVALLTFCDLVAEARAKVLQDSDNLTSYADAVATFLGLLVSKSADYWSNLCIWRSDPKNLGIGHVFARHAVSMVWDYAEGNPLSGSSGSWSSSLRWTELVLKECQATHPGIVRMQSAIQIADTVTPIIATDPPYYDNVPYADLSDFFYVWIRKCLRSVYPELLGTLLVPKAEELVADPFRHGGQEQARDFFEGGMANAFAHFRGIADPTYPTTIYYAFKQAEEEADSESEEPNTTSASTGWETFLQGLSESGWQIDGTWPVRTELGNRTRSMGSNALASSIVLVCRPRSAEAPPATRKQFITALRQELPAALRNLQHGNIAPVDLAQAAIGPGMAVFTRYSKVIEADGSAMTVRTALGLINHALDEILAEQEGEFDALTRWAIAWFEQHGMDSGPFGTAEVLSKAKDTGINRLEQAGIVHSRAGKVSLVSRDDLPESWEPSADRTSIWEATQHLLRYQLHKGEAAAATLLRKLGGQADIARDLAYRLYTICERKGWTEEARAYNGLVVAWPELVRLAQENAGGSGLTQQEFA